MIEPGFTGIAQALAAARYEPVEQTVGARDAILYALGLGIGDDPLDPRQLRYVYESGLQVFPTMAVTLCYPQPSRAGSSLLGLDLRHVFHLYQRFECHAAIPLGRPLVGQTEVTGVFDKGPDRGLVWTYRNRVCELTSGALICTLEGASLTRQGGGSGGAGGRARPTWPVPARASDREATHKTMPQSALIYRLSGDYNPFHVDPRLAREGGFNRPILHGRCTFGIAGRALLEAYGDEMRGGIPSMQANFAAPVYPGETIRTEMWHTGDEVLFRCTVPERGAVVLDAGSARIGALA